jgi:hypothetical protein
LFEEMYNRICEENGPADPVLALSRLWRLLAESGGDLDRAERWLQWLQITYAHTYVTVIPSIGKKAVDWSGYMAAIIRRLRAKSTAALYQEAEVLLMM